MKYGMLVVIPEVKAAYECSENVDGFCGDG
jgi:hypothetical protein